MQDKLLSTWATLSAAPHRLFFASGISLLVFAAAWWFMLLAARQAGVTLPAPVPAMFLHGGFMLLLAFTPFIFGFLLTVFPRWQPAPSIPRKVQVTVFTLLTIAHLLFVAGLFTERVVLAGAVGVLLTAWMIVIGALGASFMAARQRANHAAVVLLALLGGFLALTTYFVQLASGSFSLWPWTRALSIWAFLVPVFFGVCHRMLPFFTSRVVPGYVVYRPNALLYGVVLLSLARAGLEFLPEWRWLASVPMALAVAGLWWRWKPRQAHGVALLTVLHVAFAWFVIAMLLYALQDVSMAAGIQGVPGLAPMHALGIGFFGGMLLAMVTRVTLGHSGRGLFMDRWTWRLFLLVQFTAVARIAGELVWLDGWLVAFAALGWLVAFGEWSRRYAGIYFRPRVDGAPG